MVHPVNIDLSHINTEPNLDLNMQMLEKFQCETDNIHLDDVMKIKNSDYYMPADIASMTTNSSNHISCFHINCQSINAHWDSLTNLVHDMSNDNFCFDVIAMSEIFKIDKHYSYSIDGYHDIVFTNI